MASVVMVTNRLRSHGAAMHENGNVHLLEAGRDLDNRAENFQQTISLTRVGDVPLPADVKLSKVRFNSFVFIQ